MRWAMNRSSVLRTALDEPSRSTTIRNRVTTSWGGGSEPFRSVTLAWHSLVHASSMADGGRHLAGNGAEVTEVHRLVCRPVPVRQLAPVVVVVDAVGALGPPVQVVAPHGVFGIGVARRIELRVKACPALLEALEDVVLVPLPKGVGAMNPQRIPHLCTRPGIHQGLLIAVTGILRGHQEGSSIWLEVAVLLDVPAHEVVQDGILGLKLGRAVVEGEFLDGHALPADQKPWNLNHPAIPARLRGLRQSHLPRPTLLDTPVQRAPVDEAAGVLQPGGYRLRFTEGCEQHALPGVPLVDGASRPPAVLWLVALAVVNAIDLQTTLPSCFPGPHPEGVEVMPLSTDGDPTPPVVIELGVGGILAAAQHVLPCPTKDGVISSGPVVVPLPTVGSLGCLADVAPTAGAVSVDAVPGHQVTGGWYPTSWLKRPSPVRFSGASAMP